MKTEPAPAAMPRITSVARLTSSGFTEVQARTLAEIVHTAAEETVEGLKHEVARWHGYLALYVMMQIAVVLLAILLLQALSEPVRGSRAVLGGSANTSSQRSGAAIHS
ncbi:hypothetical protein SAMN02799625_03218 [Methylobacterium sp. UNC300MFChir4.1]|uniref:hypothetical protein n=1 Tax=Methylobacterium sp. UNC300MFChir4.1 TaxID=1502747 RepID=UPI0008B0EF97|nr:hypothetical protein [Methylobacterium sp. UNC300MFChir4.1]SEO46403.1 hypothetical protein SAMN02799625_03218 [Methylobacterium sp. UNC300MFChir4.1]